MAKRLVDTEKYEKEWFQKLSPRLKCAWEYICLKCDHAGFWNINMPMLSFCVGEPVTLDEIAENFDIEIIDDKIRINGFIEFQYGCQISELNERSSVHKSVLRILKKHDKSNPSITLSQSFHGRIKDQDKNKDLVLVKDKDIAKIGANQIQKPPDPMAAHFNSDEVKKISDFLRSAMEYKNTLPPNLRCMIPALLDAFGDFESFADWFENDVFQSDKANKGKNPTWRSWIMAALRGQLSGR